MITLSPKKAFQENEEAVRVFRGIVENPNFRLALLHATVEFFHRQPVPTSDQIAGVNAFVDLLMNLGEADQPMPTFPVKRISVIADTRKNPSQPARHD